MSLDNKTRRALRARGHHLKPVVIVGTGGLSDGLVAETARALDDHELIKLKLADGERDARAALLAELCRRLEAESVQVLGRTALIYRPRAEDASGEDPRAPAASATKRPAGRAPARRPPAKRQPARRR